MSANPAESITGYLSSDTDVAYVKYSSNTVDITQEDAVIAMAGPLANLAIGCLALMFYLSPKRSRVGKMLTLVMLVSAFVSFGVNILPISPNDGYYVFAYLFA